MHVGDVPPPGLVARYRPEHLEVFNEQERKRFLADLDPELIANSIKDEKAWEAVCSAIAWELLYRVEPDLYERLIAGEGLHPRIFDWLPSRIGSAVEVGAGTGRLTVELAPRCDHFVAVEPAVPMRSRLQKRLANLGLSQVEVKEGFFDSIPVDDDVAGLVTACSSLTTDTSHGGSEGLAEMERICAPDGLVVIIWPNDPDWLKSKGYELVGFPGELAVEFPSAGEAAELAEIFYPQAAERIAASGKRRIPYDWLGVNPPNTLCWKRLPSRQ